MPNLIGMPLIKGNSHSIVSARIEFKEDEQRFLLEGAFISLHRFEGACPVVGKFDGKHAYGILLDYNKKCGTCTVVRSAELVTIRTNGNGGQQYTLITLDENGLFDPDSDVSVNGGVLGELETAVDRNGVDVYDCIKVSLGSMLSGVMNQGSDGGGDGGGVPKKENKINDGVGDSVSKKVKI